VLTQEYFCFLASCRSAALRLHVQPLHRIHFSPWENPYNAKVEAQKTEDQKGRAWLVEKGSTYGNTGAASDAQMPVRAGIGAQ
jgi:hypothetical protein